MLGLMTSRSTFTTHNYYYKCMECPCPLRWLFPQLQLYFYFQHSIRPAVRPNNCSGCPSRVVNVVKLAVVFFASLKGREFSFRNGIWKEPRPINPVCESEKETLSTLSSSNKVYFNVTKYHARAHITYMIVLQIQKWKSRISCFLTTKCIQEHGKLFILAKMSIFVKFRWMAFCFTGNDFFDQFRFFYDELPLNSDFFEEPHFKMVNYD